MNWQTQVQVIQAALKRHTISCCAPLDRVNSPTWVESPTPHPSDPVQSVIAPEEGKK